MKYSKSFMPRVRGLWHRLLRWWDLTCLMNLRLRGGVHLRRNRRIIKESYCREVMDFIVSDIMLVRVV